jgi:hypothetical protein
LVIGEASADPELVDRIEESNGGGHPLLGRSTKGVLNLLVEDVLFGGFESIASLGDGASLHCGSPVR